MRKRKIIENVLVTDIVAEGKGMARINGIVSFIDGTVPGDEVDVWVTKKKKDYIAGRVFKWHQKSSDRLQGAFCHHFKSCGGCIWQDINYEQQLAYKDKIVLESIHRIGKITPGEILPIIGAEESKYYRNKLEYTFSNNRWLTEDEIKSGETYEHRNALGFHIPGRFDKILDIEKCYLQDDFSNTIRLSVRQYALKNKLAFFDLIKQEGLLRNLLIRNTSIGEWMVVVSFFNNDLKAIKGLMEYLRDSFPQITSLNYVVNSKKNDSIYDQQIIHFSGKDHIVEKLEKVSFKIRPKSFFQTNTYQALKLYQTARSFADFSGKELVYDLYTGLGSIALFIAKHCKKVIGIEQIETAVEDARINAQENNIQNAVFFSGDMKDVLNDEFIQLHGKPDIIITDPPRAGMHEDVINCILDALPEKIVYVSCNPVTQARDMALLQNKYIVAKVQAVDMFPHTYHIENVALLVRK